MKQNLVETEILEGFRTGDARAFEQVMQAYGGLVRYVVRGFWSSPFTQEEAMQEIWLQAYGKREQLDPARLDSFSSWLSTLARRKCIDILRKQGRMGQHEELVVDEIDHSHSQNPEQMERVLATELAQVLAEFKSKLRPQWQEFFQLYFESEMDYGEIMPRLGISRLRCKYMKRVLCARARRNRSFAAALGRMPEQGR